MGGQGQGEAGVLVLAARLEAGGGVFAALRRRRAASRLARLGVPAASAALAAAYVHGRVGEKPVLLGLADQACVDAVAEVAAGTGDEGLSAVLVRAALLPSDPARRALFLFLAERFEEYAEHDPDGGLLADAHAAMGEPLRPLLAERALRGGRSEWVRAVTRGGAGGLTGAEWEAASGICVAAGAAEELWRLLAWAPAAYGVRMVLALDRLEWRPAETADRLLLDELIGKAGALDPAMAERFVPADVRTVPGTESVRRLVMTPDGKLLCGSVAGAVRLWRLPSGEPAGRIPGGSTAAWHLAVAGDGGLLVGDNRAARMVSAAPSLRWEGQIGWWRLPSGEPAGVVSGDRDNVRCLALAPDGTLAATGDEGGLVRLWRLPSGEPAGVLGVSDLPLVCLAVTTGGDLLLCGDASGRVTFWSLPDGARAGQLQQRHFLVNRLLPGPDGRSLFTYGANGEVSSWYLPSGRKAATLVGEHLAEALAMSPDGRYLAAGTVRGVRLWRLPSVEPIGEFAAGDSGVRHVAVLPEASLVVTHGWGSEVGLWDLESGAGAGELPGGGRAVEHVVVTPDGRTLAAVDTEGTLRVWQLWRRQVRSLSAVPVRELASAEVQLLMPGASPGERAWLALVTALARQAR